jgi:ferredoxin--NADP+ reductase
MNDSQRLLVVGAAGTGIAPFRSFWRRIFYDGIPNQPTQPFSDDAMFWLLSGFANTDR